MKSAVLVTYAPNLSATCRQALALLGANLAPGVAQLTDPDGHLFTLYAGTPDDLADYRDATLVPATPGLEAASPFDPPSSG